MGAKHSGILRAVRTLIETHGGRFRRTHQGGGPLLRSGRAPLRGDPGIPDGWATHPCAGGGSTHYALAFWVEAKTPKDKLTPAQKEFKAESELAGVPVVVGDVEEVAAFLRLKGIEVKLI